VKIALSRELKVYGDEALVEQTFLLSNRS